MPFRWKLCSLSLVFFALAQTSLAAAQQNQEPQRPKAEWTICIANDNCPDYTWGWSEQQTRQAFADVVKAHLDEMKRTDGQAAENRDRYNAAVTQEVLCFLERYPERKAELAARIREGRLYVSPYLCNSLWAFQGLEGALRTLYPARRLETELDIRIDTAHHIELPSLPWGAATILAGCGIKRLSVPFYNYDSTWGELNAPPLFRYEGPDGSRILVALDRFACGKANYTQGAHLLAKPETIGREWIPHYESLGREHPLRTILASGTHGDISPGSGDQARSFADKIIQYNGRPDRGARLVNATLPQFWEAVDASESGGPWLPTLRGDFGHSWDLWPVSLAKYAADMREGERRMLAAESLIAVASGPRPEIVEATRDARRRAEWRLAMLSDHAWNGTDERNQRHNAELRRQWSGELNQIAGQLVEQTRSALQIEPNESELLLFNPLCFPRRDLVTIESSGPAAIARAANEELACQIVEDEGRPALCFVSPEVPALGWRRLRLGREPRQAPSSALKATPASLESPYYRATVDLQTGGLSSLVHKGTGRELVDRGATKTLGQSVYFDGKERSPATFGSEVAAIGPVLARLRIHGTGEGIETTTLVTVYAELDRVDIDIRVHKPVATQQERLCHVFPILGASSTLRIATPGAILRPRRQPAGDLLPGADVGRFAVQEHLNVADEQVGVTLAPLDAFALRLDLEPLSIEALGNDQNYREVTKDQHGVTEFRFRYSLQGRAGGYDGPGAAAFGRAVGTPLMVFPGRTVLPLETLPRVSVPPSRAVATCLKPADDPRAGGAILRVWETAGVDGPVTIDASGYQRAVQTDLLERDQRELPVEGGKVALQLKAHGLAAVRLMAKSTEPAISFVAEMESPPDLAVVMNPSPLPDGERAKHAEDVRHATEQWNKLVPQLRRDLTAQRVRELSRWAKPQMEKYQELPPLEKVVLELLGTDAKREKLVLGATIDTLPTHSPLVTRWLKVYLLYDPKGRTLERVVVTIRGEKQE